MVGGANRCDTRQRDPRGGALSLSDHPELDRLQGREEEEKLTATVALAIQPGVFPEGYHAPGRLFTYLPLPSGANYPCNIHAPFALTVDRQTLRNEKEEGLAEGSLDQYVFSN